MGSAVDILCKNVSYQEGNLPTKKNNIPVVLGRLDQIIYLRVDQFEYALLGRLLRSSKLLESFEFDWTGRRCG